MDNGATYNLFKIKCSKANNQTYQKITGSGVNYNIHISMTDGIYMINLSKKNAHQRLS